MKSFMFTLCLQKWKFMGFVSWFDNFMTHCPMRSVIKLSHLQVLNTASRLPTGTKRGKRKTNALPYFQLFFAGFLRWIYWSPAKQDMGFPQTHSFFFFFTIFSPYFFQQYRSCLIPLNPDWGKKRERAFVVGSPEAFILPFISYETRFCKLAFCYFYN